LIESIKMLLSIDLIMRLLRIDFISFVCNLMLLIFYVTLPQDHPVSIISGHFAVDDPTTNC